MYYLCYAMPFFVILKIVDKFQSEIQIPNVCILNLNSNFKTKLRKFELRLKFLLTSVEYGYVALKSACAHFWCMCLVMRALLRTLLQVCVCLL